MIKKRLFYVTILLFLLIGIISAIAHRHRNTSASVTFFAMDTVMSVSASGENAPEAVEKVKKALLELDTALSVQNPESKVYQLNSAGTLALDPDIRYLLAQSLTVRDLTDGAFNICIYPLMEQWGFTDENYRVPAPETLADLCSKLTASQITIDESAQTVSLSKDTRIDLGGIAKGYASQIAGDILKAEGISSALLNLGGNVYAIGSKEDHTPWVVAVKNPKNDSGYLCLLRIRDKCVITSGGYERYFEENGKTYHHILDPRTGYPAESGLLSVTIVSAEPTLADAFSTALFVMGKENAISFWRGAHEDFDFILYDSSGKLYVSEGLKDDFSSEFVYEFVEK